MIFSNHNLSFLTSIFPSSTTPFFLRNNGLSETFLSFFRYDVIQINNGQWWRLITANFCHSNWNHWGMNIMALWFMDIFYRSLISLPLRAWLLFFSLIMNVFLLHFLIDIDYYVGLSGALHGYLVGAALFSFLKEQWLNRVILVFVTLKLFAENMWSINTETEKWINANVIEEAHYLGALSGVFFYFMLYGFNRFLKHFHSFALK
jgi:rhomboid family GlyGly-CTERM serine protease